MTTAAASLLRHLEGALKACEHKAEPTLLRHVEGMVKAGQQWIAEQKQQTASS